MKNNQVVFVGGKTYSQEEQEDGSIKLIQIDIPFPPVSPPK